jgi:hypothetical protein
MSVGHATEKRSLCDRAVQPVAHHAPGTDRISGNRRSVNFTIDLFKDAMVCPRHRQDVSTTVARRSGSGFGSSRGKRVVTT